MTIYLSPAVEVLLGFTLLTALLALSYPLNRVVQVFTGKAAINAWGRDRVVGPQPDWTIRAQHAHLNALENLLLFTAVVVAAYLSDQLALIEGLAYWYLAFRLGQALVHLISTSPQAVFVRANLWIGQMVILLYWIMGLVQSSLL